MMALLGGAAYMLYNLLRKDPKREELEDELDALKSTRAHMHHWTLVREASAVVFASEGSQKMSAAEVSLALYRELEVRCQREAAGHEARIKVLEADIKTEDAAREKTKHVEATEVDRLRAEIAQLQKLVKACRDDAARDATLIGELRRTVADRAAQVDKLVEELRSVVDDREEQVSALREKLLEASSALAETNLTSRKRRAPRTRKGRK
jgi:chromosome segregation ATPase